MVELKTLKDMNHKKIFVEEDIINGKSQNQDVFISMNLLKAEAVKWIKETQKSITIGDKENADILITWIKHFFNISEEDLCTHDFGNTLLMSNPPQRKCIKCGYTEFV